MKKILQIGSAFIGVIVGAGFASGKEILQYFTSFGLAGILGALLATILFSYLGFTLMKIGSRMDTASHKEAIYQISGPYLGKVIDYIIIFTIFGVGVVMIAGAGSNLKQQFGLPSIVGTTAMVLLILLTVMVNIDRFVAIIGSITPFLIIVIAFLSIYSLATMEGSFASLAPIASSQSTTLPNWFISAINYVSFNIALGASMAIVMGGAERNEQTAALGGLIGGAGIGLLITLSHLAIFANIESVGGFDMPILELSNQISPLLGLFVSIVLFGMIFNTGASMFFSFGSRFLEPGTKKFRVFLSITLIAAYALSFVGFTDLVSYFYPLIGYLGLFLMGALVIAPFRMKRMGQKTEG